jgi:hypothetical protein
MNRRKATMSGTQQQDILSLPAMVTMPIGRWNQVLDFLGSHPWREANPLIVDIHRQIQDAVNAKSMQGMQSMPQDLRTREPQS